MSAKAREEMVVMREEVRTADRMSARDLDLPRRRVSSGLCYRVKLSSCSKWGISSNVFSFDSAGPSRMTGEGQVSIVTTLKFVLILEKNIDWKRSSPQG